MTARRPLFWRVVACHAALLMWVGTPLSGSAFAQTATPANPAKPAVSAAAQAQSVEQLNREIADLRALQDGVLPPKTPLAALFEIDLGDPAAVAQRAQVLVDRLATDPIDSNAAEGGIAALRTARDRLRLAFLRLPADQRNALRAQDRLRLQSDALQDERQQSAELQASAEEARDSALEQASTAQDSTARALATEEARLLAQLSEIAALRQTWVEDTQTRLFTYRALLARMGGAAVPLAGSPEEAGLRYQELDNVLRQLRGDAGRALAALNAPSEVPVLESSPPIDNQAYATHAEAAQRVRGLRGQLVVAHGGLAQREAQARLEHASDVMNTLQALQARRVLLLAQLAPAQRDALTGLTRSAWARVLGEVDYLRLMVRWYPVKRMQQLRALPQQLAAPWQAGLSGALAAALALLVASGWVRYHVRGWVDGARKAMLAQLEAPTARWLTSSVMHMLARLGRELVLLLTTYLLFDRVLADRWVWPEWDVLRSLAYAYAWYRLALAFLHRVVQVAVSRYWLVSPVLNGKMLRSLRWVARMVLVYAVYVILAQALLGRGALYGIAREVALLGLVLIAWRLILAWRAEVTAAYLAAFPEGSLAERVRANEGRSQGLVIAFAAFGFVAARGLWIWLRDSALRFEQTRKALAYLFRRQLERKSKNQGVESDNSALPDDLLACLTEDAATGDLRVNVYPHLDEVLARAKGLNAGGIGAVVALAGDRGVGKTSWLLELEQRVGQDLPCTVCTLQQRDLSVAGLCAALSAIWALEPTEDPDVLVLSILAMPPQVVMLDLVQNLMLRAVGGLAAQAALLRIAQATSGQVLWVLAYARWPFEFLQRTRPDRDVYDQVVMLKPWSESQIGELLDARMAHAGYVADYETLLSDPSMPRAVGVQRPGDPEEMERSEDRYHRLVWDYADGNPRVALHFFRLSLVWSAGRKVDVRLFPTPSVDALEEFEWRTWLVLACLVQHENLRVSDAVASLRFPQAECARALQLLQQRGFLTCVDGCYRVAPHWARAVHRFLQRKKMLFV
jgi:hypothetical protein